MSTLRKGFNFYGAPTMLKIYLGNKYKLFNVT